MKPQREDFASARNR